LSIVAPRRSGLEISLGKNWERQEKRKRSKERRKEEKRKKEKKERRYPNS
jgi:hypothetical protein